MTDIVQLLERWQLDVGDLRERMYRAPTPRERERWHGLWLLAQGWSTTQVAEALEREPHTIGNWLDNFRQGGAQGLVFEQTGGSPPVLNRGQQNQLKSAVQNPPGEAGIELSNWNWKVVSWDALVEAFVNKEVDLAWNGHLAYLKIKRRLNDTCQVVAMVEMIVGLVWGWSPYPEVRWMMFLTPHIWAISPRSWTSSLIPMWGRHPVRNTGPGSSPGPV